jgi:biopolymer transport protein ExbB
MSFHRPSLILNKPMKRIFSLTLSLALAAACHAAEDLDSLAGGVNADLQKAITDLNAVRKEVEDERLPLSRKLTELEQKLIESRAAYAKAQRFQENQLVELNALKAEAKLRGDEVKYIDSVLGEYAKVFRSRLNFAEEPRFKEMFEAVEKAAVAPDLSPADRFKGRSVLLTSSLKRAGGALGGEIIEGRAIDSRGTVQQGKVALIGPVATFSTADGGVAGLLQQELNKAEPTVAATDKSMGAGMRSLVLGGSGTLGLDPSGGNAFKLAALEDTLWDQIRKGGWAMVPLIGLLVATFILAAFKWYQLSRVRLSSEKDLQVVLRHLEAREVEQALTHARGVRGMAGDLLVTAIEHSDEKKEYIEEILYEKMLGARAKIDRGLAFLALAATTGPLLGLLGTVMGMIATFKMISGFGSGDPKLLAAGISEALICTATGMGAAIPALLLHAFLSRKAKSIIGSMEQTAVGFINGVPQREHSPFA